jgi:hypothetical protein
VSSEFEFRVWDHLAYYRGFGVQTHANPHRHKEARCAKVGDKPRRKRPIRVIVISELAGPGGVFGVECPIRMVVVAELAGPGGI